MNNLKNIAAAFEAFIADAVAKAAPLPGVSYKVEQIDQKILVSATFDADAGYTDEPWVVLAKMPQHDKSYEIANEDGTVISYAEYDLSDDTEVNNDLLANIAHMAIFHMNLPDINQDLLDNFIPVIEDNDDVDSIVHGDMTPIEYLECLMSGNMDFWNAEWDEKTSRMHDFAVGDYE